MKIPGFSLLQVPGTLAGEIATAVRCSWKALEDVRSLGANRFWFGGTANIQSPPQEKKDHIFLSAFCGELNMILYPFEGSGMKNDKAGKFLDLSGTNVNKCILKL